MSIRAPITASGIRYAGPEGGAFPAPPAPRFRSSVFAPVRFRWQRLARKAGRLNVHDSEIIRLGIDQGVDGMALFMVSSSHIFVRKDARWWARWLPWWPA